MGAKHAARMAAVRSARPAMHCKSLAAASNVIGIQRDA